MDQSCTGVEAEEAAGKPPPKARKPGRTLADPDSAGAVRCLHIAEALSYRHVVLPG